MGSSRFVPLVIAGFIGLLIGWLLGPDVDEVEEALGDRLTQIEQKVDAIQAPLGSLQTGFKSVDERVTQVATQVQAVGAPTEAVTALSAKLDAASAATKSETDALAKKIDAIAAAPAAAPAATSGGDFAALASGLGNSGAILLAGQSAVFGSKTLTVSGVDGSKASMTPGGDIATGASVDLGGGCSVTLKGIAGPAALLAPAGCGAPAAGAAPSPAAAAAPAPAAAAPAAPAPAPAMPASGGGANGALVIGQTAVFGEKKAFLSRVDAGAQTAYFFVPGKGQVPGKAGAAVDLGDGCSLTVASVEATSVSVQPTGCGAAPAGAAAPAAASAAPAATAPAPAPAPAAAAPAPAASGAPGAGTPIGIGQTATFGEKRIFLSRLTQDAAHIVVVGTGPQEVKPGASADLGRGCSAKLEKIDAGTASFTPTGC